MSVYTATKQESKPYSKTNSLSKKKQLQIFAKISFPKTFLSFMTSDVQVWSKKFHLHVNKIHNLCWLVYSVWVRTVALYFLNIEVMSILKYKANANQWMQWSECCCCFFNLTLTLVLYTVNIMFKLLQCVFTQQNSHSQSSIFGLTWFPAWLIINQSTLPVSGVSH